MKPTTAQRLMRALSRPRLATFAVLLGAALTLPSLWTGFEADDHIQRVRMGGRDAVAGFEPAPLDLFTFGSGDPAERQALLDEGTFSWWVAEDFKLDFWRPLSSATHVIDEALWPEAPALHHLHSVAWFLLLLLIVARLYRRLHVPWIATLAVLLFALDDAHGPAVGFISNRNALVAAVFGLGALLAHDRWRRDGWSPGAWVGPVLMAGALLAGEAAVGVFGYLLAYALFLDPAPWRRRLAAIAPQLLVGLAWMVAYKALGHGTSGSGIYLDPSGDPGAYLVEGLQRVPVLMLAQFALPWADFYLSYPPDLAQSVLITGVSVLLHGTWLMWPLLRRDPAIRFWAVGAILACLPIAATFPSDRLLVLVGVGTFGQMAALLATQVDGAAIAHERGKLWHSSLRSSGVMLFVLHLVLAPVLLPVRAMSMATIGDALSMFDRVVPTDPSIEDKTLVCVTAPFDGLVSYLHLNRASRGERRPERLRLLSTGVAATEVTRVDARTLRLRPADGFLATPAERMLRGPTRPFAVGDEVRMAGLVVTVTALTEARLPAEATFRFDRPLEDPSFVWRSFDATGFEPWTPPAVGASETLAPLDFWGMIDRERARQG